MIHGSPAPNLERIAEGVQWSSPASDSGLPCCPQQSLPDGMHVRHHSHSHVGQMSTDPLAVEFFDSNRSAWAVGGSHMLQPRAASSTVSSPVVLGPENCMAISADVSEAAGGAASEENISWFGFEEQLQHGSLPQAQPLADGHPSGKGKRSFLSKNRGNIAAPSGLESIPKSLLGKIKKNFLGSRSRGSYNDQEQLPPHAPVQGPAEVPAPSSCLQTPASTSSLGEGKTLSKAKSPPTSFDMPRSNSSAGLSPSSSVSGSHSPSSSAQSPFLSGPLPLRNSPTIAGASGPLPLIPQVGLVRGSMSGPLGTVAPAPPPGQGAEQKDSQTVIGIAPGASPAALEAYLKAKAARQQRAGKRVVRLVEVPMR